MTNAPSHQMRRSALAVVIMLVSTLLSPAGQASAETVVLVQAGDSLSSIAFEQGVTLEDLMAVNGLTDPDLVYMGQELVIPGEGVVPTTAAPLVVTVEYGESLSIIAARHGVTVSAIMEEIGRASCRERV